MAKQKILRGYIEINLNICNDLEYTMDDFKAALEVEIDNLRYDMLYRWVIEMAKKKDKKSPKGKRTAGY